MNAREKAIERLSEALCAAHMGGHGGDCDTPDGWRGIAASELDDMGAVFIAPALVDAVRDAELCIEVGDAALANSRYDRARLALADSILSQLTETKKPDPR